MRFNELKQSIEAALEQAQQPPALAAECPARLSPSVVPNRQPSELSGGPEGDFHE